MPSVKFGRETLGGLTGNVAGDFILSNKFDLEIEGITIGGVNSIDGVEFEVEVVEYQDGEDINTHYRPGRFKPGKLIIKRDWSSTKEFLSWRQTVLDGATARKSISIMFKNDSDDKECARINFFHCYPAKWTGPALNARTSAHAGENLEVVFEELQLKRA